MRRFKFSDETVLSAATTTLHSAREHLERLTKFGITEEYLGNYEADIITGQEIPGELENRIGLRRLTNAKNAILKQCTGWGRDLQMRLDIAFGKNSPQYNEFPSDPFWRAYNSENRMKPVMEALINLAQVHREKLSQAGQTDEELARGTTLLDRLHASDNVQELGKDEKLVVTEDRHDVLNRIYDTTNTINRVGRIVFAGDPEAQLFRSKWPGTRGAQEEESPPDNADDNDDEDVSS